MATTPRITLLVASLHILFYLLLSLRVVMHRRANLSEEGAMGCLTRFLFTYQQASGKVGSLSGGERSRLQLALLMLSLLELSGTPAGVLWGCGVLLLSARLLHALGLGGSAGYSAGRFAGALLTFVVLLAMALAGLWRFFAPLAM